MPRDEKEVAAFVAEVIAVCRRHGLAISHEDHHGAFEVVPYNDHDVAWLERAINETVQEK